VPSGLAKDLNEEIGSPLITAGLSANPLTAFTNPLTKNDALHGVEAAHRGFDVREGVERADPGGIVARLDGLFASYLAVCVISPFNEAMVPAQYSMRPERTVGT